MLLLAIYVVSMLLLMLLLGMAENHLKGRRLYFRAKKNYRMVEVCDSLTEILDDMVNFCIIFSIILPLIYLIIKFFDLLAKDMLELVNG